MGITVIKNFYSTRVDNERYHIESGISFIWDGDEWLIMAQDGAVGAGEDGADLGIGGEDGADGVDIASLTSVVPELVLSVLEDESLFEHGGQNMYDYTSDYTGISDMVYARGYMWIVANKNDGISRISLTDGSLAHNSFINSSIASTPEAMCYAIAENEKYLFITYSTGIYKIDISSTVAPTANEVTNINVNGYVPISNAGGRFICYDIGTKRIYYLATNAGTTYLVGLNITTGAIDSSSTNTNLDLATKIVSDGLNIWVTTDSTGMITRYTKRYNILYNSWTSLSENYPYIGSSPLIYDGARIWGIKDTGGATYVITSKTTNLISGAIATDRTLTIAGWNPYTLVFDGRYIWAYCYDGAGTAYTDFRIYKIDPTENVTVGYQDMPYHSSAVTINTATPQMVTDGKRIFFTHGTNANTPYIGYITN